MGCAGVNGRFRTVGGVDDDEGGAGVEGAGAGAGAGAEVAATGAEVDDDEGGAADVGRTSCPCGTPGGSGVFNDSL